MAPARRNAGAGLAQHAVDLDPAFDRHRLHPRTADPLIRPLARQVVVAEGQVADDTLVIHDDGNIAGGRYQGRYGLGVKVLEQLLWSFEMLHGRGDLRARRMEIGARRSEAGLAAKRSGEFG